MDTHSGPGQALRPESKRPWQGGAGQVALSTTGRPPAPVCPANLPREGEKYWKERGQESKVSALAECTQATSGYMAKEMGTESISGHRVADSSSPDPPRSWAHHGTARPATSPIRECQEKEHEFPCCLGSSSPLTLPFPCFLLGRRVEWAAQRGSGRAGRHPVRGGEGRGLVTAALRTSLVWGYRGHGEKRWRRGEHWGLWPLTGYLSKGHMPR